MYVTACTHFGNLDRKLSQRRTEMMEVREVAETDVVGNIRRKEKKTFIMFHNGQCRGETNNLAGETTEKNRGGKQLELGIRSYSYL